MILVDFSGIMHANIARQVGFKPAPGTVVDESLIRHSILNSIRTNNSAFRHEYGSMVVAIDASSNWRHSIFPYYKARRKTSRDASALDWKIIHQTMNKVKGELKDNFPYRVVEGNDAEADDVIAVLTRNITDEKILILSADNDLIQLHENFGERIKQFDPIRKKFVEHNNPEQFLKEKIIIGDAGDDVPNILMDDDTFVRVPPVRQKPMTKPRVEQYLKEVKNGDMEPNILKNYRRNDMMVNLSRIPSDVQESIMLSYEDQGGKNKSKIMPYIMKHRLRNLLENVADF